MVLESVMDIKSKVKKGYNSVAEVWHKSRITTFKDGADTRLLKQNRPHLFVEKPAMMSRIKSLSGKNVLTLGCGSGEECQEILLKKPDKLTGVDISDKLIEIARSTVTGVEFFNMDAENLEFENQTFDFVYCSLMMDYFESWERVLNEVYRVLKPGGIFQFSNLHPVKWSAESFKDSDGKSVRTSMGFEKDPKTKKVDIHGDYLGTILHEEVWNNGMEISYFTKPISLMFKEIRNAGFLVNALEEPKAIDEAKEHDMGYWEIKQKIPDFVIFECQKPLV